MDALRMCRGRMRFAAFNRAKRFSAVEELVNVVFGGREKGADGVDGAFRDDGAVGRGDGDFGASGAESFGEVVAGLLGADEEEAGGCSLSRNCGGLEGVGEQRCCEGFGYGLWRDEVGGEADGGEGFGGGWADCRYAAGSRE